MAGLSAIGLALPSAASQEAVRVAARDWLRNEPEAGALFDRFLSASGTLERHFIIPPKQICDLKGMRERAALFEEFAPALGAEAARQALQSAGIAAEKIAGLIFTSCSCPVIPAPDTEIIFKLGLRQNITRVPVYQYGCAGGVAGLGLGAKLCAALEAPVLLLSVELCSLVFQRGNTSPSNLVGAAIFADGAAAAVITPESSRLEIVVHESFLIPGSRELMGYDLRDEGAHLRLDKALPQTLAAHAPGLIASFLKRQGLRREEVKHWLFHPGGAKILDLLEQVLELAPEQAPWSREVLTTVGNLSSATALFVIDRFLKNSGAKAGETALLVGVGPGLTIEQVLFRIR